MIERRAKNTYEKVKNRVRQVAALAAVVVAAGSSATAAGPKPKDEYGPFGCEPLSVADLSRLSQKADSTIKNYPLRMTDGCYDGKISFRFDRPDADESQATLWQYWSNDPRDFGPSGFITTADNKIYKVSLPANWGRTVYRGIIRASKKLDKQRNRLSVTRTSFKQETICYFEPGKNPENNVGNRVEFASIIGSTCDSMWMLERYFEPNLQGRIRETDYIYKAGEPSSALFIGSTSTYPLEQKP